MDKISYMYFFHLKVIQEAESIRFCKRYRSVCTKRCWWRCCKYRTYTEYYICGYGKRSIENDAELGMFSPILQIILKLSCHGTTFLSL